MQPSDRIGEDERLRGFRALTDPALSRLGVPALLAEILRRVRAVLRVDTAAILLLDGTGHLVPVAADGVQEGARQGERVPVGAGFAGRVVRVAQPVIVTEIGPGDTVSPALAFAGIRSVAGVPIVAAGDVAGVLHVGSRQPREFTAADMELLQIAADRAAVADLIRSQGAERNAAVALQNSLLPPRLPQLPGLSSAARYVPGHEFGVGGDWYDVFRLPSGWVGVVIGDVSGHGLASAVIMGRVRSALRAYTLVADDPAQALALLDEKVHHFEAGTLTTALYAMISPDRSTVRVSAAGHLRPVLAATDRPAELVDMPVDAPLGIGRHRRTRTTTMLELPPGALLLSYTDGLVERRDQIIDVGIKTLIDTVRPDDPETVCASVLARFATAQPTDDIAVLALRRT